MENLIHVQSSHGDIYCDKDGFVKEIHGVWENDPDGPSYILNIAKFDFKACENYWGKEMDCFDILELSGLNKDGTTFKADHKYMMECDDRYNGEVKITYS